MRSLVFVDMPKLVEWKEGVVKRLTGGIGVLFKNHGIEHVAGEAEFTAPGVVSVKTADGVREFQPKNTIISTGSRPMEIPGFAFDGENVLSSTEALSLDRVPELTLFAVDNRVIFDGEILTASDNLTRTLFRLLRDGGAVSSSTSETSTVTFTSTSFTPGASVRRSLTETVVPVSTVRKLMVVVPLAVMF